MFTTLFMAAALTSDANDMVGFAQFERSKSLIYITETVDISIKGEAFNSRYYQVRYRWSQQIPFVQREAIFDSRACPAIREIVVSMGKLPMPQPAPIILGDAVRMPPIDGNYYQLKAPSSFLGGIAITSNMGTPLATWVDHAVSALQPCLPKNLLP